MNRATGVLIGAAFVAAAIGLSLLAPSEATMNAPFVGAVRGLDSPATTRTLTVTVTGARLADRVQTPEWTGTTDGVWLVVDITFDRRIQLGGITGSLSIGDTEYSFSRRTDDTIDRSAFPQPGLPWGGSVLVELPGSVLDDPASSAAVMRFASQQLPLLDGALDYTFDLTALEHETSITIHQPERVGP
jgi:hypothetical protein